MQLVRSNKRVYQKDAVGLSADSSFTMAAMRFSMEEK
jgi:hypothetical protein